MKQYKLVKIYPGSPKINFIVTFKTGYNHVSPAESKAGIDCYLHLDDCTTHPEYWEEIVDKNPLKLEVGKTYELQYIHCKSQPFKAIITRFTSDEYPWMEKMHCSQNGIVSPDCYKLIREIVEKDYDILSFKHKGSNHIWKNDSQLKDTFCIIDGRAPFTSLEEINKYPKVYLPYSVKRLSDNTIFTIGDYVRPKKSKHNGFTITGFELDCNNEHILALGENCGININKINLYKKPLFCTEDGVDIYEGDGYWKVSANFNKSSVHSAKKTFRGEAINCNSKYFKTSKAAEKYILMNKPCCLSIKDITNYYIKWSTTLTKDSFEESLQKLVKSKL